MLSDIGKARLIGVDTPEVFGTAECYGRALVYLWTADGRFVNALLARDGYALQLTIPPNVEYARRFGELAREARTAGRGLWRACGSQ